MFITTSVWRSLLIGSAALSIGASAVAGASAEPAAPAIPAARPVVPSAAQRDVELIARQFGWDVDATARHLRVQHTFGRLIDALATEHAETYAGAEFAPAPGETSRLMFKGRAPHAARELIDRYRLPIELAEGLRHSEQELQQRSLEIVRRLARLGYRQVSAAVLPTGQIQVAVNSDPEAAGRLPEDLLDGVEIVQSPRRSVRNEAVEGGVKVYASASGGSCTSGFSVRSTATGATGVSTAGHCTGIDRYSTAGPDPVLTHQAEHIGLFGDVEWKTSTDVETATYWASPSDHRAVNSVWPSNGYATNMITCIHSRMNAGRFCDEIYSTFAVSSSGATTAGSLIAMDNDNTLNGDSGGPWSYGTIADGGHRGDLWIWFGYRNVFTRAALFPVAIGAEVMT